MGPPSSSFILIHTLASAPIKLFSALLPIGASLVTPSFHHSLYTDFSPRQCLCPSTHARTPFYIFCMLLRSHCSTLLQSAFSLSGFKTPPFKTNTSSCSCSYWFTHGFYTILCLYHIFLHSACSACYQLIWLALQP
jgi:hypothetical protein